MIRPGKMIKQVLQSLFMKPATLLYPFKKSPMPEHFRGEIIFHPELCIGCQMCVRDCPSRAIKIKKTEDNKFEAEIDLGKCIYCAQCVMSCPKKALESTKEFELAVLDKSKLKIIFSADPKKSSDSQKTP
ncbi:MAG: 4Fe-4S binding protein [Candidatus Omnitrophica bacterium]|nr:4Fe-4S binding protein [Candidatus Omnitrophota bacterium]